jgi:hypothetical protein
MNVLLAEAPVDKAGISATEGVTVLVALAALMIAGMSLWLTALRPARLNLTYMEDHTKIGKGGQNEVPNICTIRAFMALTNSGARAGLLERVGWGSHFEVKADEALMFALARCRDGDDPRAKRSASTGSRSPGRERSKRGTFTRSNSILS